MTRRQLASGSPPKPIPSLPITISVFIRRLWTQLKSAVLQNLRDGAASAGLRPFEVPRAVTLIWEEFTIDNGLCNPTGKFARRAAAAQVAWALGRT